MTHDHSPRPRVLNRRTDVIPADAVYVGRSSKWGNPFRIQLHLGTGRNEAITQYRQYLLSRPEMVQAARYELRGRDLVCWCAPNPCHADVLLEIANA